MGTVTQLRNEWAEAVEAAGQIAEATPFNQEAYNQAWAAVESAQAAHQRAVKLEAAQAALDLVKPEDRDPGMADSREPLIPSVSVERANAVPKDFIDLGSGHIVPYADQNTEGYIRSNPSSVQMRGVMQRFGPELRVQAQQERDAFLAYVRGGRNSRRFRDSADMRAALDRLDVNNLEQQEGVDADGGYLVPTDQRVTELFHDAGAPGGMARQMSSVRLTSRDKGYIPSGGDIVWARIAEGATPSSVKTTFGQRKFSIEKSGFNSEASMELLADEAYSIADFLAQIGMEAKGRYEDQMAIVGDGDADPLGITVTPTATPRGLVAAVADATPDVPTSGPTMATMAQAYLSLPSQFRGPNTYLFTTSSFIARLWAMARAGGDMGMVPTAGGPGEFMILGRPIVAFDGTGWADAAVLASDENVGCWGDFSNYVFLDRLGTIFMRDDSVDFKSDEVAYKMRERYDSFFLLANAFRILTVA